jgi:hypothetical protein
MSLGEIFINQVIVKVKIQTTSNPCVDVAKLCTLNSCTKYYRGVSVWNFSDICLKISVNGFISIHILNNIKSNLLNISSTIRKILLYIGENSAFISTPTSVNYYFSNIQASGKLNNSTASKIVEIIYKLNLNSLVQNIYFRTADIHSWNKIPKFQQKFQYTHFKVEFKIEDNTTLLNIYHTGSITIVSNKLTYLNIITEEIRKAIISL